MVLHDSFPLPPVAFFLLGSPRLDAWRAAAGAAEGGCCPWDGSERVEKYTGDGNFGGKHGGKMVEKWWKHGGKMAILEENR